MRRNRVATCILVLFALLSVFATVSRATESRAAESGRISVVRFGVVPNDGKDDRQAIQECIIAATKAHKTCFIAAGEYVIDGDLWVQSNTRIQGEGDKTVLNFSKGFLRALKNGSTKFHYARNYINEIIPGAIRCTLSQTAKKGTDKLAVDNTKGFAAGDYIFTFNNRKDTWAILEDRKQEDKWNGSKGGMARSEIFQIADIKGNTIVLDKPTRFEMPKGSPVTRHPGSRDISIDSLKIVNNVAPYGAIFFEQPFEVKLTNLTVEGNGGIWLVNHPYRCLVKNCRVKSTKTRAISVQHFAVENSVLNNEVDYTTGGDCAILVMMSSYDNEIAHNNVRGHGKKPSNEGGIYIHATSYDNKVHHNHMSGTTAPIGAFYAAFDNQFYNNTGENNSEGLTGWYAGPNTFTDNSFIIKSHRPGPRMGAYIYGSRGMVLNRNSFSGPLVFGVQIGASTSTKLQQNHIDSTRQGKGYKRVEIDGK